MKKNLSIILCSILTGILVLAGCGGGGGGVATNNGLLSGTYYYVMMTGTTGGTLDSLTVDNSTVSGTVTFNGDGTGTDPGAQPLTYTVLTDNSLSFDDFVGQVAANGEFFVATDTIDDGDIQMIIGVKQTSGADETLIGGNYSMGAFVYNGGSTSYTSLYSSVVNNAGLNITTTQILPGGGGSLPSYAIADDGSITYGGFNATIGEAGQATPDGEIFVGSTSSSQAAASLSLALPSTGMTDASLSGTYALHQFMDDDVANNGGSFLVTRANAVFDGSDTVTGDGGLADGMYTETASSTGSCAPNCSGPFNYAVAADGTFALDPTGDNTPGFMLADGSVIAMIDTDSADSAVSIWVGIKKP